jgi:hypothetical protein
MEWLKSFWFFQKTIISQPLVILAILFSFASIISATNDQAKKYKLAKNKGDTQEFRFWSATYILQIVTFILLGIVAIYQQKDHNDQAKSTNTITENTSQSLQNTNDIKSKSDTIKLQQDRIYNLTSENYKLSKEIMKRDAIRDSLQNSLIELQTEAINVLTGGKSFPLIYSYDSVERHPFNGIGPDMNKPDRFIVKLKVVGNYDLKNVRISLEVAQRYPNPDNRNLLYDSNLSAGSEKILMSNDLKTMAYTKNGYAERYIISVKYSNTKFVLEYSFYGDVTNTDITGLKPFYKITNIYHYKGETFTSTEAFENAIANTLSKYN